MKAEAVTNSQVDYQHSEIPKIAKPPSKIKHYFHLFTYYFTLIWQNSVIALLAIQSLYALFIDTKFIIDDYPQLELLYQTRGVQDAEIRAILYEGIALMISTIISILFAIRLTKAGERASKVLELIVGTALIIWYQDFLHLLENLDYDQIAVFLRSIHLGG